VPTTSNAIGYAIPAPWQSGLSNGASAGGIIGLIVSFNLGGHSSMIDQWLGGRQIWTQDRHDGFYGSFGWIYLLVRFR
jgi:uncharacterized protein YidB (DUF937 family)